ncbi:hypothetical protein GCM10023332_11600 [Luteimonas vadosa]|uniref:DUF4064 domain-containing protein n=1 Tax=Luteimonas vadosa TaxID=1165507 RepID=A0ABP9DXT7_9GAMM
MKRHRIEILRALAALLLALTLCTLFGAFSGYWEDPDLAHRIESEMPAYVERNPSASPEEIAAFHQTLDPQPRPIPPHTLVAIVKSNLHLVLPIMLASLLLLRPHVGSTVLVGVVASALVAIIFGLTASLLLIGAHVLYGLLLLFFPPLQRHAA